MYGRYRDKTRPQAQSQPRYKQQDFSGGLSEDAPATKINYDEVALLENIIAYPDRLEGRSGTQRFSLATLPGSGTHHYLAFHPNTQKFLLHRGAELYLSTDAAAISWTQVKLHGMGYRSLVAGGGGLTGSGLGAVLIRGMSATNTENGTAYWRLSNSGTTRTVNVYSDSLRLNLIGTGSRSGDGGLGITMSNASGFGAFVTVTYGGATSEGTFTPQSSPYASFDVGLNTNDDSKIFAYKGDFLVAVDSASRSSSGYDEESVWSLVYVNTTNAGMAFLGGGSGTGYGQSPIYDSGTEGVATPYGRRYLYTLSRIVNSSGNPDSTKNRTTGTLVFEGPANDQTRISGDNATRDYGEYWSANAVSVSNPNTVSLIDNGNVDAGNPLTIAGFGHYTHTSLYGSLDVGTTYGIDPVTGEGNNREIYVWIKDVDISSTSLSDDKTDDELRARYAKGFGLRTRFFTEMSYSEIGEVAGSFLYSLKRGQNQIRYCQLAKPEYMGFYRADLQFFTLEDGVQELRKVGDSLVILCSKSTYLSDPKIYEDVGTVEPVFVLRGPSKISSNIGVVDYGTVADIDADSFIAFCSDRTIRAFSGNGWGQDLASNKVTERLDTVVAPGSVGIYGSGVYLLWYKNAAADTTPTQCLRLGFGGRAGNGWSRITGSEFPFPPLYTGALVINDSSSRQRIVVIDNADGYMHWVETFTNAALAKIFKDGATVAGLSGTAITATFRPRELFGDEESHTCYHEESHIYLRPAGSAYVSGFSLTARAYVDGGSSASGTVAGASLTGGDIQYFERIRGKRIQQEYEFSQSGFLVVSHDTHFQVHDTKAIADGPSETNEAGYQNALAGGENLKHWLTRPSMFLNRATGSNYNYSGITPSFVTGPDGKTYGLNLAGEGGSSPASYTQPDGTSYSDFTLMFWVKDVGDYPSGNLIQITGNNNFAVSFTSSTVISINGVGTVTITNIGDSAWHHFAVVRSGSEVGVYQNGALKGRVTVTGAKGGSSYMLNPTQISINVYDVVLQNTAITAAAAALAYYYTSVTSDNGTKVLPLA